MIKVVWVIASNASRRVWSFEKIPICLVTLADSFGGVIERTLPTSDAFSITKIVILLAFVASVIIFVGGISRTLTFLSCSQKDFAIFALDGVAHFG
jgi:uncharacterized membrane protein YjdF